MTPAFKQHSNTIACMTISSLSTIVLVFKRQRVAYAKHKKWLQKCKRNQESDNRIILS